MIGIVFGVILHLALVFASVVVSKVACNKDIIDDDEMALVVSIFIPLGVMCFIGALWVGEIVSDRLS